MRLLTRDSGGELRLTKDLINEIPPYAILSHTWDDPDDEVTYQDLVRGRARTKFAYKKLQFCATQAAHDGLEFFWIDTCCIDRSNNTELSEAINSMYRWYRDAVRCYVYLADMATRAQMRMESCSKTPSPAIKGCRWFTRGWTLQELIAPRSVEFFCSNGYKLGDKASLEQELSEITRLPNMVLRGCSLSQYSFEERISWAQHRETTREEDKAYSLFGICGVHMPLIYGEGGDNALRRLWDEISKRRRGSLTAAMHAPLLERTLSQESTQSYQLSFRNQIDSSELVQQRPLRGCLCQCHSTGPLRQTLLAQGRLGYLSFSKDSRRSCQRCPCEQNDLVAITYFGPRWLTQLGIFVSVLRGERLSLNLTTAKIVPPDSELFIFARTGNLVGLKELLSSGRASVADICAPYGLTALSIALINDQEDVVRFLISQGASQAIPTQQWSIRDIYDHFASASRIDYDISASATMKDYVKMSWACGHWNSLNVLKKLNRLGELRFSRMHNAVLGISCEQVSQAAMHCIGIINEPDSAGRTPLHWAALLADEKSVHALLRYGADPSIGDANGASALHMAAAVNSEPCARAILDNGGRIDQYDRFGSAPLHWASHVGALSILELLLKRGASSNSRNIHGETSLCYANRGLQLDAATLLIESGATTDSVDTWGYDAILDAVFSDSHDTLQFYLSTGVDVSRRLHDGRTILHIAALNADARTIEILTHHALLDVDPEARDKAGRTATEYLWERRDSSELRGPFHALVSHIERQALEEEFFDAQESFT